MPAKLILGLQWGDEGKGKVVDIFSGEADLVVRFQGGANSGHTVQVGEEKFFLHCIPSGILRPGVSCLLGRGMVLDLFELKEEMDSLRSRGVSLDGRLFISLRAHLVLPHHKLLDQARERAAGEARIGTTGKGIGPCYAEKVARTGIQLADLFDDARLASRLRLSVETADAILDRVYGIEAPPYEEVLQSLLSVRDYFRPYAADVPAILEEAHSRGARILFEGAQAVLLDIDAGSYPYVTSSTTIAAGVWTGAGFPVTRLDSITGIMKCYTTRVGGGPFPTEIEGETADRLRKAGNEYGTTTRRPRRIGWLDLVTLHSSVRSNCVDSLFFTKLDILTGLDRIPVCVAYDIDGERLYSLPEDPRAFERAVPVYEELEGWSRDIRDCRTPDDLPPAARAYLDFVCESVGVPVSGVSVGPKRDQRILFPR